MVRIAVLVIGLSVALSGGAALGQSKPERAAKLEQAAKLDERIQAMSERKRHADAVPLARRAVQLREEALGPDHGEVADSLRGLADLYLELRRYPEAEPPIRRAIQIYEKLDRADPEDDHALPGMEPALAQLGRLHEAQDRFADAEASYLAALRWTVNRQLKWDPGADSSAITRLRLFYSQWGEVVAKQGRYPEAEAIYQKALALRRADGKPAALTGALLKSLAEVYKAQGRAAEADRTLQRARDLEK